jgi:integrase
MARKPSVWFREATGWYMTTFRGEQVKLSTDKAEAERAFHALLAKEPEPETTSKFRPSFRKLADLFLAHAQQTKEPQTYELQRYFLQSFCDHVKKRLACDLKVADVTTWLLAMNGEGKQKRKLRGKEMPHGPTEQTKVKWGHNSQVTGRAIVRACLNWGVDQGYLTHSPLGRLKAGSYHRRERILTPEERFEIKKHIRDGMFSDFFFFLEQTGCRPFSEAAKITPEMIDWTESSITFTKHKNARKGKARTIYLTERVREMMRRRAAGRKPGELVFHTRNGEAFAGNNTVQRVRRFERLCGIPRFSLYALRHSYIVEALERGLSSDIIAELVGNTAKTISRYYNHLDQKKNTLREAARLAVAT